MPLPRPLGPGVPKILPFPARFENKFFSSISFASNRSQYRVRLVFIGLALWRGTPGLRIIPLLLGFLWAEAADVSELLTTETLHFPSSMEFHLSPQVPFPWFEWGSGISFLGLEQS